MNIEHQNALISELKMMIYIESHVNVLSLVGAITKGISRGELYVLMEFCKLGSMSNFLRRHRTTFINELLDEDGDQVDEDHNEKSQLLNNVDGYLAPSNLSAKPRKSRYKVFEF